ncbi:2-dehydro-3-deoxy-D-gluconate 5-dehydrogenase KduD [Pseudorhodobacter sp. E13]|uniref:2-dehydro-3-deoxy-D-gluconate 5-dehydrogenase KduD n=1 Tax=Pseudorhodobacter sp. E13 TaxID=2487931 RepID=UPI000F8F0042|nr:2-dehydro-3-deoxy-D-gluconate 5-dehydrogenase KduD [Pseudorhodobacter sp. E13]RUS59669.1 2-dehydro-3-deoxy-D-gluconate 5-dehydrogenase KduD [Pseudorhodobacter sp. E13]
MNAAFSLNGRRALVTGANTGIGQAIAIGLAQAGAEVLCAGRRACDDTVARITGAGGTASSVLVDFADPMAGQGLFDGAGIDILVNNAGIIRRADAVEFTESDWDAVMDVNLKALFFTTQAFAKAAFARGGQGAVVNIASLLSFQGGIRVPSYTASKHGVVGLTKLLANEWAAKGINVNAVAPGYIETNNTEALRADADRNRAILERIPAGRWGQAEDIAGAAVYLCTPAAKYVHGAVLNVDGGWLAR